MKQYQLTEKLSTEAQSPLLRVGNVSTRFFFRSDDCDCYTLQSQIDYMIENGLTEMDLWLAKRETNTDYFYCRHFGEVGEKSEGGCGKTCDGYKPRNRRSGVCMNYGYTYEKTERCYTLKLSDELVFQNER